MIVTVNRVRSGTTELSIESPSGAVQTLISSTTDITNALVRGHYLSVRVDGFLFSMGEKYTVLEMGFAILLAGESGREIERWLLVNGERIFNDNGFSRPALRSGGGVLLTSNPVLFALAYKQWWHVNGEPLQQGPLAIPTHESAVETQRDRRILNDFNLEYRGKLPEEWNLHNGMQS
jgi:hypothetical protein